MNELRPMTDEASDTAWVLRLIWPILNEFYKPSGELPTLVSLKESLLSFLKCLKSTSVSILTNPA